jgi:hypothetical protein
MKKLIYFIALPAILFAYSCKKTENKIYFEGGKNPEIFSNTTNVLFKKEFQNNNAITFSWTNPEYRLSTGVSSHDVVYLLEIDTVGGNFKSSNKFQTSISKALSVTYTVGELNKILETDMSLSTSPEREYQFEVRVISSINKSVQLISNNKVTFKATPYADKQFWLVGGASDGGWNNPLAEPYKTNQKFRALSPTKFELITRLKASEGYLVLPVMGSWDNKYCLEDGVDRASTVNGGSFVFKQSGGQDFLSPAEAATYKITFDFQSNIFTVVKQP